MKAYDQRMGGVNLLYMLISFYRTNVRSQKYYIKIIFHLIDLYLVNVWLICRRHCLQQKIQKKSIVTLLKLRLNIAKTLLQSSRSSPTTVKPTRPSLQSITSEQIPAISSRAT